MVRGTSSVAVMAMAAGLWAGGCQTTPAGQPLVLAQTPPTVQAAFQEDYRDAVIRTITRQSRGGQDYYTFQYQSADGGTHDVEFNGAGNEIDKH